MIAVSGATGGSVFSSDANPQKHGAYLILVHPGANLPGEQFCMRQEVTRWINISVLMSFIALKSIILMICPHDEHTPKIRISIAQERLTKKLFLFHKDFAYNDGDQSTPLTYRIAQKLTAM
jgi:hypothetical protein